MTRLIVFVPLQKTEKGQERSRFSCHCILLFLVKAGADPSQGNPLHWDWAPLHWATLADNLELVQVNRVQHTFIQVLADFAVCTVTEYRIGIRGTYGT